jgi:SAM-dependent methyltransferase
MKYYNKLHRVYNLQFTKTPKFWKKKSIPKGQIEYHKKNFSKYFDLPIKDFKEKKILESGAGPGVHATILALMGSNVYSADILKSNVRKMKILKKLYKLNNLKISLHDFRKEYNIVRDFDLVSCHNWIQHTPNPNFVLKQLVKPLKVGGRIYISCYLSGSFRFFITQIARSILKKDDFKLIKKKIPLFFPSGFKIYKNPDDIGPLHITDDFFTPYCVTTTYGKLIKTAKNFSLKPYTKVPKLKKFLYRDNLPLQIGFIKNSKKIKLVKKNYFSIPEDEFKKSQYKIKNECIKLSKKIINNFNKKSTGLQRVDLALRLYKIRSQYCYSRTNQKYKELKKLLTFQISN